MEKEIKFPYSSDNIKEWLKRCIEDHPKTIPPSSEGYMFPIAATKERWELWFKKWFGQFEE